MLLKMSDGFGLTTLAEGIETEAQAAWLLAHGCRYGQGYLVDQPLAFDHLVERVATTRPARPAVSTYAGEVGEHRTFR
jgi:EAL domain-containing protein (putative c-di-GMP-specific phosphodiesterase class I)